MFIANIYTMGAKHSLVIIICHTFNNIILIWVANDHLECPQSGYYSLSGGIRSRNSPRVEKKNKTKRGWNSSQCCVLLG